MTPTYSLILPAACRPLSPAEADAVLGGADTATDDSSFTTVLSNIEKVSKVFNYMARIFPPPARCSTTSSRSITP